MAKKRTLCPHYTKRMQHMTVHAARSNGLTLQLLTAGAIREVLKDRKDRKEAAR